MAYSSDDGVRYSASSGGFCKSFLWYLVDLDEGIDEAIITRTGSKHSPLIPEVIATKKREDIFSTRTNSVYAPTNPISVLKDLDPSKGYVFTGLGCHVRNLRLLQRRGIAKNVKLVVGLLCSHTPNINIVKQLFEKLNLNEKDVIKIEYRGNGWPGGFTAYMKNGSTKYVSSKHYFPNDLNNAPQCCKSCSEVSKEADVVVCDPWRIISPRNEYNGKTLVLCRNVMADRLVVDAAKKKYIIIESSDVDAFFRSQGEHLFSKILRKWRKRRKK
ncbi:Coenzyme F420 hydrogenase/dehydrogenase, beta subunit C-terminal domain [Candidatus Marithioploca araucensis]|uniref:Coenzyme F420 hydrogenase/dehydrogenase, beta subunit C-terminal domain n=1 Tax=Candidatus Marithioploca araucensis TaxID=70273 RepID=A0ABT7VSG8_9GAMM|nr:Coenzyme F420 hydrogenase/dehydrogenase, beta subunit C-terminal domain [Candidatus Marithioploca araucensis]